MFFFFVSDSWINYIIKVRTIMDPFFMCLWYDYVGRGGSGWWQSQNPECILICFALSRETWAFCLVWFMDTASWISCLPVCHPRQPDPCYQALIPCDASSAWHLNSLLLIEAARNCYWTLKYLGSYGTNNDENATDACKQLTVDKITPFFFRVLQIGTSKILLATHHNCLNGL